MIAVKAPNISAAWLAAASRLLAEPKRKALHTAVHISDPTAEVPEVRTAVDELLAAENLQGVETVANTIFPAAIAASSRNHAELVKRYLRMFPILKRYDGNRRGTYFGRLIQYPTSKEPFDQIDAVIKRIGIERANRGPKQARYEATIADADEQLSTTTPVYVPGRDNSPMAFPCLSHCSFQLDTEDHVHLLATYRSQYMVQRGYGNYLGLGRLLAYVAEQSGLQVGHLTVAAGLARVEPPILPVRDLLGQFSKPTIGA